MREDCELKTVIQGQKCRKDGPLCFFSLFHWLLWADARIVSVSMHLENKLHFDESSDAHIEQISPRWHQVQACVRDNLVYDMFCLTYTNPSGGELTLTLVTYVVIRFRISTCWFDSSLPTKRETRKNSRLSMYRRSTKELPKQHV